MDQEVCQHEGRLTENEIMVVVSLQKEVEERRKSHCTLLQDRSEPMDVCVDRQLEREGKRYSGKFGTQKYIATNGVSREASDGEGNISKAKDGTQ